MKIYVATSWRNPFQWFMTEPGIVTAEHVAKKFPDHGLVYAIGKRGIEIVRPAPERKYANYESEVRFLRFAIINGK